MAPSLNLTPVRFFLAIGSLAFAVDGAAQVARTYRAKLPGYHLEYRIPAGVVLAEGEYALRPEVTFDDPSKDGFAYRLGNVAYETRLSTFFSGVEGNFRSVDCSFDFDIIKIDSGEPPLRSTTELAAFIGKIFSRKLTFRDGSQANDLGSLTVVKIGATDVVMITSVDLFHIRHLELPQGKETTFVPHQYYFMRVDERLLFCLRVEHHNEKKLNAERHAAAQAIASEIIGGLKFTPR